MLRYYDTFNAKLEEFIVELCTTFPEVSDLRSLKTSFVFAKTMNAKMPQQLFKTYVVDAFGDRILAKDDGFFLEHDYKDIIRNASSSSLISGFDPNSVDIVGQLKEIWTDMSRENKDVVWKYLGVLIYLSGKCTGQ